MEGEPLPCGCTATTRCPEAERLHSQLVAIWFGEAPGASADMFDSFDVPQKQRVLAMRASLAFHEHRGALARQCEFQAIAAAACKLFVPPPPRRLPVGNYGRRARAAMQLTVLEALAAGLSFTAAAQTIEADRRSVYSWTETDPVFARAVEMLRKRGT